MKTLKRRAKPDHFPFENIDSKLELFSIEFRDLLKKMFSFEHEQRTSAAEVAQRCFAGGASLKPTEIESMLAAATRNTRECSPPPIPIGTTGSSEFFEEEEEENERVD